MRQKQPLFSALSMIRQSLTCRVPMQIVAAPLESHVSVPAASIDTTTECVHCRTPRATNSAYLPRMPKAIAQSFRSSSRSRFRRQRRRKTPFLAIIATNEEPGQKDEEHQMNVQPAQSVVSTPTRKRNKVVSAVDAVRLVHDGDTVAVGGFVGSGVPEALIVALKKAVLHHQQAARSRVAVCGGARRRSRARGQSSRDRGADPPGRRRALGADAQIGPARAGEQDCGRMKLGSTLRQPDAQTITDESAPQALDQSGADKEFVAAHSSNDSP
jgi:hypothetical protein